MNEYQKLINQYDEKEMTLTPEEMAEYAAKIKNVKEGAELAGIEELVSERVALVESVLADAGRETIADYLSTGFLSLDDFENELKQRTPRGWLIFHLRIDLADFYNQIYEAYEEQNE